MQLNLMFWFVISACGIVFVESTIVKTPLGLISGWEGISRDGLEFEAWTRVPYAQPPVGKLRFKPPQPVTKWAGVLNATENMPRCLQSGTSFTHKAEYLTIGQEDCLYLNIFKPKRAKQNLPVLFYVHGGAFQTGSSSSRNMGSYFMDEDVILVLTHYRLNVFGFFSLEDEVIPGNYGLKDQALAAKWVYKNIKYFGGDPKRIVAFGTSAGGASSHYLLKSPSSEGYLSGAVSDSGTINHVWSLMAKDHVRQNALRLAEFFDCDTWTSDSVLNCLQNIDGVLITEAMTNMTPREITLEYLFGPVIELKTVENAFATEDLALRPSNKPWITSFTSGEYLLFYIISITRSDQYFQNIANDLPGYLANWISHHANDKRTLPRKIAALTSQYLQNRTTLQDLRLSLSKMHGDGGFTFPAIFCMLRHRGPKWVYRFEHRGEISENDPRTGKPFPVNVPGHAEEGIYYFQQVKEQTGVDYAVSKRLIQYVVNFAYYSNPTPSGSPLQWGKFDGQRILRITTDGDYMANAFLNQQLNNTYTLWETTIALKMKKQLQIYPAHWNMTARETSQKDSFPSLASSYSSRIL